MERARHFQGLLILFILAGLGAMYLWQNSQPSVMVAIPAATATPGEATLDPWQLALETQVAVAGMPLPTPDLFASPYVPPTLPPADTPAPIVAPIQLQATPWATPTFGEGEPVIEDGPTLYPSPTGLFIPDEGTTVGYAPPPEQVPLGRSVNDHFWMSRPVDSSANSADLFYYAFGSDGPQDDWRVHHGIDIPNPVGEPIRAGGSGTVVFAGDATTLVNYGGIDVYPSYGNVVVIQHDFGYHGQKLYTLYAHMAAVLVEEGMVVESGDIMGLIGGTGDVSGPHVHMEVRLGENDYFAVLNPLLWIAPYIGYGVVAGRVTDADGRFVEDVLVTLTRRGRTSQTTTTYIQAKRPGQVRDWHVVPDPVWQENFVMSDVPAGDYLISVTVNGQRYEKPITVVDSTVNFITLGPEIAATPQPVENE